MDTAASPAPHDRISLVQHLTEQLREHNLVIEKVIAEQRDLRERMEANTEMVAAMGFT